MPQPMANATVPKPEAIEKLFVLIHGTWAPKSAWTQDGSLLIERLRSTFGDVVGGHTKIIAPAWSGANRESERIEGGQIAKDAVAAELDGEHCDQNTKVFFITHSHGTDVALKALELLDHNGQIAGIATFNSPNILTLKRDFGAAFQNLMQFLNVAFVALFTCNILFLVYKAVWGDRDDPISLIATVLLLVILGAAFGALQYFKIRIAAFLDRKARVALRQDFRRSVSEHHDVPIMAINSSSDEAWNGLNVLTSLAQLPFYLSHRLITFALTLVFFFTLSVHAHIDGKAQTAFHHLAYPWTFSWVTAYPELVGIRGELSEREQAADDGLVQHADGPVGPVDRAPASPLEQPAASSSDQPVAMLERFKLVLEGIGTWFSEQLEAPVWWIAVFAGVASAALLNAAFVMAIALLAGYLLAWLVQAIALGDPERLNFEFLTTRKLIGLVPLNFRRITFFDAASNDGLLSHSGPYSDSHTLNRVMLWIKEHSK